MADIQIGAAVKQVRMGQRLTQKHLSERMATSRSYVTRIEGGRHFPTLESVQSFAVALGVETWELVKLASEIQTKVETKRTPIRTRGETNRLRTERAGALMAKAENLAQLKRMAA